MHTHLTTSLNLCKFDKHPALHSIHTIETSQTNFQYVGIK